MEKSLLIVEDDQDVRESLQMVLEAYGYTVTTAENGQAALDLLGTGFAPCVILLDIMMPIMDGWKFLEVRNADPKLAAIPTIILSAADPNNPLARTAEGFLPKPVEITNLLNAIAKFCG